MNRLVASDSVVESDLPLKQERERVFPASSVGLPARRGLGLPPLDGSSSTQRTTVSLLGFVGWTRRANVSVPSRLVPSRSIAEGRCSRMAFWTDAMET